MNLRVSHKPYRKRNANMKVSWILWWMVNLFCTTLFAIGTAFVWLREIDGTGAIQTTEAKLISFLVLLLAFIFLLIMQFIWLIINFVVWMITNNWQYVVL